MTHSWVHILMEKHDYQSDLKSNNVFLFFSWDINNFSHEDYLSLDYHKQKFDWKYFPKDPMPLSKDGKCYFDFVVSEWEHPLISCVLWIKINSRMCQKVSTLNLRTALT